MLVVPPGHGCGARVTQFGGRSGGCGLDDPIYAPILTDFCYRQTSNWPPPGTEAARGQFEPQTCFRFFRLSSNHSTSRTKVCVSLGKERGDRGGLCRAP
jgi:hypothetical protein